MLASDAVRARSLEVGEEPRLIARAPAQLVLRKHTRRRQICADGESEATEMLGGFLEWQRFDRDV